MLGDAINGSKSFIPKPLESGFHKSLKTFYFNKLKRSNYNVETKINRIKFYSIP